MMWLLLLALVLVLYQTGVFSQLMNSSRKQDKDARDLLDERYARGEVSTSEYNQIKETLNNHS